MLSSSLFCLNSDSGTFFNFNALPMLCFFYRSENHENKRSFHTLHRPSMKAKTCTNIICNYCLPLVIDARTIERDLSKDLKFKFSVFPGNCFAPRPTLVTSEPNFFSSNISFPMVTSELNFFYSNTRFPMVSDNPVELLEKAEPSDMLECSFRKA